MRLSHSREIGARSLNRLLHPRAHVRVKAFRPGTSFVVKNLERLVKHTIYARLFSLTAAK
ncbi:hypothetical protein SAMN05877831_101291 [Rhodobacter maris]|uniref:Uncharacterized protein n=1 Tax=Rhodobacter maris TaxID=446682 RepID=A0A285RIQ5_9RHOB|nr:hypothetical protein SAMN05877831_101291 [Rhodobacter maris]